MADKPACPDAAAAPALAASWGALSAEEARTAASLLAAGQAHLFASWPPPGERDDAKKRLLQQARPARAGGGGCAPRSPRRAAARCPRPVLPRCAAAHPLTLTHATLTRAARSPGRAAPRAGC